MEIAERRAHFRLLKADRITCQEITYPLGQTEQINVKMVNVSEGGVGIEAPVPFEPGTLLQVALLLEGWQRYITGLDREPEGAPPKPLTSVGRVVRCVPAGDGRYSVGIQFVDIWDDHWNAMRLYLEKEREKKGGI
jgi:hypothetical protein